MVYIVLFCFVFVFVFFLFLSDVVYILKLTKVKKTNKIILIAFTWELGTSVDAPKRMVAMCHWNFFFGVNINW